MSTLSPKLVGDWSRQLLTSKYFSALKLHSLWSVFLLSVSRVSQNMVGIVLNANSRFWNYRFSKLVGQWTADTAQIDSFEQLDLVPGLLENLHGLFKTRGNARSAPLPIQKYAIKPAMDNDDISCLSATGNLGFGNVACVRVYPHVSWTVKNDKWTIFIFLQYWSFGI